MATKSAHILSKSCSTTGGRPTLFDLASKTINKQSVAKDTLCVSSALPWKQSVVAKRHLHVGSKSKQTPVAGALLVSYDEEPEPIGERWNTRQIRPSKSLY